MVKIPVILIVLNSKFLVPTINSLNLNKAVPIAILMEKGNGQPVFIGNVQIPTYSLSSIQKMFNQNINALWLICGFVNGVDDICRTAEFLKANGISSDNIVNFVIQPHINRDWLGNIRFIENHAIDYFATGTGCTEAGLNLNCINGLNGINLAGSNQDLRQGYLTAKYVFEHQKTNSVKFVFIGLTPYIFRYDNLEDFAVCPRDLQYSLALNNAQAGNFHSQLLQMLIGNHVKKFFNDITEFQADPNFTSLKSEIREFPASAITSWKAELKNLTKTSNSEVVDKNMQILKEYIELCIQNGAKPVGVVFPFAPAMHDNYDNNLLNSFRKTLHKFEEQYDFTFIDLFDLSLDYEYFYDMAHLNLAGSLAASSVLNYNLYKKNIRPFEEFNKFNYKTFQLLSQMLDKDEYNDLMKRIFEVSINKIRQKKQIKVGFVLYDSSMWCGDDIYNFFENSEKYEPTVFLCLRKDKSNEETVVKDFWHGVEQFKSKGINVVGVSDYNTDVPKQDIIIFLIPYFNVLPKAFNPNSLTTETLIIYIAYGLNITTWDTSNDIMEVTAWKNFFESQERLLHDEKSCKVGMPRGYYSGQPKMDVFFKKPHFDYNWKMAQPDAVKIIYAPHFAIDFGIKFSTFQHNYQFIYEYAKTHPETSWVFKPHPNLLFSAVSSGVFKSNEAFAEYLQRWNDLPNAKVETGAYYQSIFATSDGMILDSSSFVSEYQYTGKPLLFLTNEDQKFNTFGQKLMEVLYKADGRDFNGISNFIKDVLIAGNDKMFKTRRKFFDKHLNYKKINGTLAASFIFDNIDKNFS
ncbi:MAG: CDP-glycerol glycerophosphotransferase family protein [Selenomonadaceae bacterium]|nr:CDP-glycerol glycerophosphotransferase family protein [Selenomonadaceae bacterium]